MTAPDNRHPIESVSRDATTVALAAAHFEADMRVESKDEVADGVVALVLREVNNRPLPLWEAGAHIDLVMTGAPTRQYSLCGSTTDRDTWRLGVLRNPDGGGGSLHVHDELAVGDTVRARGPRNNFQLVDSPRYLFIAGGIGITPILPMIEAAESSAAEWQLVYGGRRRASMAFVDELTQHGDRVSIQPEDEVGLLDLDGLLASPLKDTLVYCCGPEALLAAVEERCRLWPTPSLHVERFAPKPIDHSGPDETFEGFLAQSELTLTVPPDRSILEVLEEAGVDVLCSCTVGTCGTCETAVLEGEPDHRDSVLSQAEQEANDYMMVCVSRSKTARLVLDL